MDIQLTEQLRSVLSDRKDIVFAYLFGSQVSGTSGPMSDLDVAIYPRASLKPGVLLELHSEIMERARQARVDLVDLRQAPPLLAYEVAASGELLFTHDSDVLSRFERKAFLHYFDTQHLRDIQNQYLRDRLQAS